MKEAAELIAFRHATWPFAKPFFDAAEKLEVDKAELARLAIEKGLAEACTEISARQKATRAALSALKKLNPNYPLTPFNNNALTAVC